LTNDICFNVREVLPRNPNAAPTILRILARGSWRGVREGVAENLGVPRDVQMETTGDPDTVAASVLARNPSLHPDCQLALAGERR
jgi:hypothetical protein